MFGRKKRNSTDAAETAAEENGAPQGEEAGEPDQDVTDPRANGPWDEAEFSGERGDYLDMGALLVKPISGVTVRMEVDQHTKVCLLYTSDAADDTASV